MAEKPRKIVARGAGAHAAGTGQVAGERAAERGLAKRWFFAAAQQAAPVRRLEGEHLAVAGEQRLDLLQRRSRARGQDKLRRLIVDHAREPRDVEQRVGPHRAPERAFAAARADLEGLALRGRPEDRFGGLQSRLWAAIALMGSPL